MLIIIVVNGFCIFVFMFVFSVMGINLRFVINVVINIGCKWIRVFLIMLFINFLVFSKCCLMNDSIINLFNMVILDSVINFIDVDMDKGIFFN